MSLSKNILEFLEWLEKNGQYFDPENLAAIVGRPESEDEDMVIFRKLLRDAASQVTKSKWQPIDISHNAEKLLAAVSKLPIDDPIDEYVTTYALREVPGAVARLKKLSVMRVLKRPSEEVTNYFRQAISCYVCKLYDAVAVLSRSALEFALRETLTQRGLLPVQPSSRGEGSIRDLINWAEKAKVLKSDSVQNAHNVRRTGNKVHAKGISEHEALTAVSLTLQILTEIYGRKSITAKKT